MSRIAKKVLQIPSDVKLCLENKTLNISGKLGKVSIFLNDDVSVDLTNGAKFYLVNENKYTPTLGSVFVETKNAIQDVISGYSASVKMIGVGFKAALDGNFLRLFVGFSHDVVFNVPSDLTIKIVDDTNFTITGFNRYNVMQFARTIRSIKKPEPYNGKGIMLNGEEKTIKRKEGKKK